MAARVTGIGGIFFKGKSREMLLEWYRNHLGIKFEEYGGLSFKWREKENPDREGETVWSIFPEDTKYFEPGSSTFMINYRVDDLDAMLLQLRMSGVQVEDEIEESEFGRFGWCIDPEGNKIELWEPPEKQSIPTPE